MKKYLKVIIPIILGIAGVIIIYQFLIVPRGEAKKLESAQREAFFECDKRWTKVAYVPSQQMVNTADLDCRQRKQQQDTTNANIKSGSLPKDIKNNLLDYTPFEFFVDSNLYCNMGRVVLHDRDSYTNMCKNWYLLNIGIDPWPGLNIRAGSHYH